MNRPCFPLSVLLSPPPPPPALGLKQLTYINCIKTPWQLWRLVGSGPWRVKEGGCKAADATLLLGPSTLSLAAGRRKALLEPL